MMMIMVMMIEQGRRRGSISVKLGSQYADEIGRWEILGKIRQRTTHNIYELVRGSCRTITSTNSARNSHLANVCKMLHFGRRDAASVPRPQLCEQSIKLFLQWHFEWTSGIFWNRCRDYWRAKANKGICRIKKARRAVVCKTMWVDWELTRPEGIFKRKSLPQRNTECYKPITILHTRSHCIMQPAPVGLLLNMMY